eukprot:Skav215023  [mRNA]  locus=scaffold966:416781:418191:- [translate_table: standard]
MRLVLAVLVLATMAAGQLSEPNITVAPSHQSAGVEDTAFRGSLLKRPADDLANETAKETDTNVSSIRSASPPVVAVTVAVAKYLAEDYGWNQVTGWVRCSSHIVGVMNRYGDCLPKCAKSAAWHINFACEKKICQCS